MSIESKGLWTLRDIKKALNQIDKDYGADIGGSYPAIVNYATDTTIRLPQLRTEQHSVYSNRRSYERRVDRFISKFGADAIFSAGNLSATPTFSQQDIADAKAAIEKEKANANLGGSSKESSSATNLNRFVKSGKERPDLVPGKAATADLLKAGMEQGDIGKATNEEAARNAIWDISLGDGNFGARENPELPGQPSQDNDISTPSFGDKAGVSTPLDTLVPVSKGSADPGDKVGLKEGLENVDKPRLAFRSLLNGTLRQPHSSKPLGDVSSPLNTLSFGTFALSGAKGRRVWGLSNPSTKISLSDLIGSKALSTGLDDHWLRDDTAGFSREASFRNGSPGGYVDANKARLEKKSVKAHARKIAKHFDGFFRDNEVGIGTEQTPRISGKKLIKELIGKGLRLGRTRKEEKGTGLKLVLVDISPSCGAIREACFAAGLAIADQDPNVVVIAHFNGYTANSDGHIVGNRQKEVPHIHNTSNLATFEAFLATGKVSGAVCFGDDDAEEVYSLLSHYCPTLWLSPDSEDHCKATMKTQDKDNGRVYDEARMYIIGGVHNAQSAVEGLRKLRKK